MLRTRWRQEQAIPYLKSRHISYYLPTLHENLSKSQLTKRMKHKDGDSSNHDQYTVVVDKSSNEDSTGASTLMYNPSVLDSSRVLLFVITNETRSLAPMTLAAHYIGLGYNVVLCVQMLPDNCNIGNDQVCYALKKFFSNNFTHKFYFYSFSSLHQQSKIIIEDDHI